MEEILNTYYAVTARDTVRRTAGKLVSSFFHNGGMYETADAARAALHIESWYDDHDPTMVVRVEEIAIGPRSMRFRLTMVEPKPVAKPEQATAEEARWPLTEFTPREMLMSDLDQRVAQAVEDLIYVATLARVMRECPNPRWEQGNAGNGWECDCTEGAHEANPSSSWTMGLGGRTRVSNQADKWHAGAGSMVAIAAILARADDKGRF